MRIARSSLLLLDGERVHDGPHPRRRWRRPARLSRAPGRSARSSRQHAARADRRPLGRASAASIGPKVAPQVSWTPPNVTRFGDPGTTPEPRERERRRASCGHGLPEDRLSEVALFSAPLTLDTTNAFVYSQWRREVRSSVSPQYRELVHRRAMADVSQKCCQVLRVRGVLLARSCERRPARPARPQFRIPQRVTKRRWRAARGAR